MSDKPVVLFLCIHNSGRSLAARVLLDHYAEGRIDVRSAGSEPADKLNPSVVAILEERGLDPTREFPKPLTDELARESDVIVTMGCGDTCPVYPGKRYLDWEARGSGGQAGRCRPTDRRRHRPSRPHAARRAHLTRSALRTTGYATSVVERLSGWASAHAPVLSENSIRASSYILVLVDQPTESIVPTYVRLWRLRGLPSSEFCLPTGSTVLSAAGISCDRPWWGR